MRFQTSEPDYNNGWHGDQPDGAELWYDGVIRARIDQIGSLFIGIVYGVNDESEWEPTVVLTPLHSRYDGYRDHRDARIQCEMVARISLDQLVTA